MEQSELKTKYFQSEDKIADWYINYAEGTPAFAEYFKLQLLKFEQFEDQSLLNTVALTVAVVNNSRDLMHDISQTMFDRNFEYSRDMVMGAIAECLNDYALIDKNYVLGEDTDEARIRMTIAILKNMPKSSFSDWNETRTEEEHKIRAIIGITEVISRII